MSEPAEVPQHVSDYEKLMATLSTFGATMDTHGRALTNQQQALARHDEMLQQIATALQQLTTTLPPSQPAPATEAQATSSQAQAAPAQAVQGADPQRHPQSTPEPRLPAPQRYDGKQGECREFITQCQLTFELQPTTYPSDRARIAYVITLLVDKARAWATSIWQRQGPECSDFKKFTEEMLRVFDQSVASTEAAKRLMYIRQGKNSVADYAVSFRTLAAVSDWNEPALVSAFHHGLSDRVKDGLAAVGCPSNLESLISHAIRLDNRLRERQRDVTSTCKTPDAAAQTWFPSSTSQISDPTEPMQIGRTRLSTSEKERRWREKCCLYCGKNTHFRASCPELSGKGPSRPAEGGL